MYSISKTFTFSAAHALINLPEDHQCSRFHGHNYTAKVVLAANELQEVGFIRDYGELRSFKKVLDDYFDHRWLGYGQIGRVIGHEPESDVNTFLIRQTTAPTLDFNPTAENIAKYLYGVAIALFPETVAVGISETDKTWAYYTPREAMSLHD